MISGSQNGGILADPVTRANEELTGNLTETGEVSMLQEISNLSRQRSPRAAKQRKKPRFSTITTRQWSKDDENKFVDVERNLSPLVEPAMADGKDFGYAEDTSESIHDRFPTGADLCRTPESAGRRDSMSGELGQLQRDMAAARAAGHTGPIGVAAAAGHTGPIGGAVAERISSGGAPEMVQADIANLTPDRQRGSGSSMAVSMPRTDSMPGSSDVSSPPLEGEITGEVTGDVLGLATLVDDDEAQASHGDGDHDMVGSTRGEHDARSPAQSEVSLDSQWGKGWDLYQSYKNSEDFSDEDPLSGSPGRKEAEVDSPAQGSPQTVDISHIRERLDESSRSLDASRDSDCEIPEGRKSFSTQVPLRDDRPVPQDTSLPQFVDGATLPACNQPRLSQQALSASPSSRRSSGSGFDFERINQEWDERRGLALPTFHSSQLASSTFQSSQISTATSSTSKSITHTGLAKGPPGYGLLAGLSALPQGSGSLFGASSQLTSSSQGDKMQADNSIGEDSGPLQCESEFRTLSGESEFSHLDVRTRLSWEEFLEGCGLHFSTPEPFSLNPALQNESASIASAAPAFECSHVQRAHEARQQDRAACLQNFIDTLQEKFEDLRRQYSVSTRMWDQSSSMPQIAVEQLQAKRNAREEEKFKSRMKDFKSRCNDQAYISWYALKQQYLLEDLEIVKRHTSNLHAQSQRFTDENRRLTELHKDIQDTVILLQDKGDIHDTKEGFQHTSKQAMRSTQQDLQLIQQKLPQARTDLASEQRKTAESRQRVQDLRRQKAEAEKVLKEAQDRAMQAKIRKALVEKQRYAHTCIITEAFLHGVTLQLRGGARVCVESATDSADVVKVSLLPPQPAENHDPRIFLPPQLSFGLLQLEWFRALPSIQTPSPAASPTSSMEAIVSGRDVQRLLRRLDITALNIWNFIRGLRELKKLLPEVTKVNGEHSGKASGDPVLSLSFELTVIRSHVVMAGGYVKPKDSRRPFDIDSSECIVSYQASLRTLPDVEYSAPVIMPGYGPLNIEAMQHAMHGSATLREALAAAIQVMERTGERR